MTKKTTVTTETLTQPKKLQGVIVNVIDDSTIKVRVEIKFAHPLYKKIIKKHKNYLVHKKIEGEFVKGDIVWILEGKPVSKNKKFYLVEKVK